MNLTILTSGQKNVYRQQGEVTEKQSLCCMYV